MKQYPNFKNVYVHDEGDKKVFCYRTGLCVYEEVLHRGCLASAGWNTAGYTLNVLDDMPTRLNADLFTEAQSFDAEADGVSLSWDWEYVDFDAREETLEPRQPRAEERHSQDRRYLCAEAEKRCRDLS